MKQLRHAGFACVVAGVLMGAAGTAFAQKSDDLKVTLGLKLWANTWETGFVNNSAAFGNNITVTTSDTKFAPIPSLSLRYGNWLASAGYFMKTNYGFPSFTTANTVNAGLATTTSSAKREEWDFNVGYYVVPDQLAITLGYKQVNQAYHVTNSGPAFAAATTTDSTTRIKAPTLGILGSAQLGSSGWALYGSGAVGPARESGIGNGWYGSTEVGVGHRLGDTGANFTIGYKVQIVDVGFNGNRARDTTNGVIAGVSYTF